MKDLLNKIQRQVDGMKGQHIVAPFYPGKKIQVRVAGAVLELEPVHTLRNPTPVDSKTYPFVGEWEIIDDKRAALIRIANGHQTSAYFELLPQIRAIVVKLIEDNPLVSIAIQSSPGAIAVNGVFKLYNMLESYARPTPMYEYIVAFDGHAFWLLSPAYRTAGEEKAVRTYEEALRKGMTGKFFVPNDWPGLRGAYQIALDYKLEAEKSREERHIERALQRAGSELLEYSVQDGERYSVTFATGTGGSKTVIVDKNLNVLTAGICLVNRQGQHNKGHEMYDLQSFVGVMRDYRNRYTTWNDDWDDDLDDDWDEWDE